MKKLLCMSCAVLLSACGDRETPAPDVVVADLVLVNGNVVTVDDVLPRASAVAVSGDRILAVGDDATVRGYAGPATEVIDLEGRIVVPGFIEGHGHYTSFGKPSSDCPLSLSTAIFNSSVPIEKSVFGPI